ncbi:cysteine hydrolase [Candidatus Parcubacteria bacterium]|jgi:nicotinamidase-related amidase|nr:cysteine hydrolase [Candidatus Parcubacteria bacterium]
MNFRFGWRRLKRRFKPIPPLSTEMLQELKQAGLAVVLIDMQKGFVGNLKSGDKGRIVPNQIAVLRHCRENNIPIIVLEFKGYGETIKEIRVELGDIQQYKTIIKGYDNGFKKTNLDQHLRSLNISTLFLMGINADCCVKRTANGALRRDYQIIISNDVISGQSGHSSDNSIPWYEKKGALVLPVTSFLET